MGRCIILFSLMPMQSSHRFSRIKWTKTPFENNIIGDKRTFRIRDFKNVEEIRFIGNVNNFLSLIEFYPYSQNNAMLQDLTHDTSKAVFFSADCGLNCVSCK